MKIILCVGIVINVVLVMAIIIMADKIIKLNQEHQAWKAKQNTKQTLS